MSGRLSRKNQSDSGADSFLREARILAFSSEGALYIGIVVRTKELKLPIPSASFLQSGQLSKCFFTSDCRIPSSSPSRYAPRSWLVSSQFISGPPGIRLRKLLLKTATSPTQSRHYSPDRHAKG